MKKITALITLFTIMLTGCASANQISVPAPDYEPSNCLDIMETDNGYYNNADFYELWDEITPGTSNESLTYTAERTDHGLCFNINSYHLWYMDKKTEKCIMVCDKPECPHDGRDTCAATFRNLLSGPMRLYDDAIYFIAPEMKKDKVTVSLYRTASDGTSIDICSELMETGTNTLGVDYWIDQSNLVIHRGYAYSSFVLSTGGGFQGFHGGGFFCTDLRTGKTTVIEKYDDFWASRVVDISACGDYIVFARTDNLANFCYTFLNINTGEQKNVPLDKSEKAEMLTADGCKVYFKPHSGKRNGEIISINPDTLAEYSENITIKKDSQLFAYNNKLYAFYNLDRTKSITVYDKGNEILTTSHIPLNDYEESHQIMLSITHDKIYITTVTMSGEQLWSCPVNDFNNGKISWTCVFDSQTIDPPCQDYVKSFK